MHVYSKTCVKRPLKNRQNKYLKESKTNGSLMKVKSIAQCSKKNLKIHHQLQSLAKAKYINSQRIANKFVN